MSETGYTKMTLVFTVYINTENSSHWFQRVFPWVEQKEKAQLKELYNTLKRRKEKEMENLHAI